MDTSVRIYMTTYRVLQKFKKEFRICDITLDLIEKFDEHMRSVNGNAAGGRHPKHKNIRTVILDIIKHNIPLDNPYKWFKMPSGELKEVYLERAELDKLIKYRESLEKGSMGYRVLTMYLFSCYCGLRFSDVLDLEWKDVDFANSLIRKTMIKTKSEVITPIFPMAQDILLERVSKGGVIGSSDKVFERSVEPVVNRTLRKCVAGAGITKYISYHSSRHTFATLLVVDKVNIYTISKYLGHSSVTMTQRYLKYDLSIAKESAKDIETFSGKVCK